MSSKTTRRCRPWASMGTRRAFFRPRLEALEDRCLLSGPDLPQFGHGQ